MNNLFDKYLQTLFLSVLNTPSTLVVKHTRRYLQVSALRSSTFIVGFYRNVQYWHYCELCIPVYFLHYLHHLMLVNAKLDVSGYKNIMCQGCRLHYFISNGRAKTELAILAFLHCGEFVSTSSVTDHLKPSFLHFVIYSFK